MGEWGRIGKSGEERGNMHYGLRADGCRCDEWSM